MEINNKDKLPAVTVRRFTNRFLKFARYWPFVEGGQVFKKFLSRYPTRSFKKGKLIFIDSDKPTVPYVVKKGIVRAHILTEEGDARSVKIHLPGDIFPISWVFGRSEYAQYYFDAFSDCEVYVVPRRELLEAVFGNRLILEHLFNKMLDKHIAAILRVGALEYSKASDKILHMLEYFCIYYGKELKNAKVEVQLSLTQQDIASTTGLTRETTGIELKKLERKSVIERKRGRYIVDLDKLNKLLNTEYDLRDASNTVVDSLNKDLY